MNFAGPKRTSFAMGSTNFGQNKGELQYRILYFFSGQKIAILAHALTKEDKVPDVDIDLALKRKRLFERNPTEHTYEEEANHEHEQNDEDT